MEEFRQTATFNDLTATQFAKPFSQSISCSRNPTNNTNCTSYHSVR